MRNIRTTGHEFRAASTRSVYMHKQQKGMNGLSCVKDNNDGGMERIRGLVLKHESRMRRGDINRDATDSTGLRLCS